MALTKSTIKHEIISALEAGRLTHLRFNRFVETAYDLAEDHRYIAQHWWDLPVKADKGLQVLDVEEERAHVTALNQLCDHDITEALEQHLDFVAYKIDAYWIDTNDIEL